MSREYVMQRLAEMGAQPSANFARKLKPAVPRDIHFKHPVHALANNYIRKERKTRPDQASWFDVHDAFIAGWNAAKGSKR